MTNETVTIEIDSYVAEGIRRWGGPPRAFARMALRHEVERQERDWAAHTATCRSCQRPVHTTVRWPDRWVHGDEQRSRGCRAATLYDDDHEYWDDSLSRSWQARPEDGTVTEAPEDYDIDEAWAASRLLREPAAS